VLGVAAPVAWVAWKGPGGARERVSAQRCHLGPMAPVLAGLAATGILIGLQRRERVRAGSGHSSPMVAWVGKRALFVSLCVVALWGLAPLAVEPAWLYVAGAGMAMGARAYVGNLPTRL
jgi:hypothetical protein